MQSIKKTVLVVDDDKPLRLLVEIVLRAKYSVLLASNGREAICYAEEKQPDLILLDSQMPGLSGAETVRLLKNNSKTVKIPIVMMTAVLECINADPYVNQNVRAIIEKTFEPEELLDQISSFL